MAVKYAAQGTAGAAAIIAILLVSMAYIDYTGLEELEGLAEVPDPITISAEDVYVGQNVLFYLNPVLLSEEYGVTYFMWDFHDGAPIEVTTPNACP